MLKLQTIDVSTLEVPTNPCDLRRDLHVFVDYIRSHEVKRAARSNYLSKTDARRLAKLMTDNQALQEIDYNGFSSWQDRIDTLALKLGFVQYDTKGAYTGYSSSSPSFQDNFIAFDEVRYSEFLQKSTLQQEQMLLDHLINTYPRNEFYQRGVLGRLDPFNEWGSALGVMPTLDFPTARRFLLKLLSNLQSGVWYSTASLVQYLKIENPYFLIPKQPKVRHERDRQMGRYGNFHEGKSQWGQGVDIPEDAPDGFERVEGRYVERFLEAIPLLAGYLDVAYASKETQTIFPARDQLKAFRLHDHFVRLMQEKLGEPHVTIQPNYEIQVESPLYPARIMQQLAPLTELVRSDRVTVLKLDKRKVIAKLAHDPTLDVVKFLTRISGRPLPQNIQMEIEEWSGHSENFVLYDGFGLFESDKESVPIADPFTVERITANLRIVRTPEMLFHQLEQAEEIPLRISHSEKALRTLPPEATTIFRTQAKVVKEAKPKAQALTLLRKTLVTLHFPNQTALDDLHQALVSARCPVQSDRANLTLTYASQYDTQVTAIFKKLADRYAIKIEEIEAKA